MLWIRATLHPASRQLQFVEVERPTCPEGYFPTRAEAIRQAYIAATKPQDCATTKVCLPAIRSLAEAETERLQRP
jgi:hypothetical protein